MAADVLTLDGQKVATVNGAEITVNVEGSMVSLTDAKGNTVNVTQTDIEASNGVIHVIDAVLMPWPGSADHPATLGSATAAGRGAITLDRAGDRGMYSWLRWGSRPLQRLTASPGGGFVRSA